MLTTAQSTMDVFNQHWAVGKYNNDFESSLRLAVEYELDNGEVNSDLLRSLGLRVNLDDTHGRGVYLHSRTKQLSKRKDSIIGQATRIKRIEAELDWVQQTLADIETNRGSLQTEPSLESEEAAKDSLILQQKAEIDIEGKLAQAPFLGYYRGGYCICFKPNSYTAHFPQHGITSNVFVYLGHHSWYHFIWRGGFFWYP
jgi:hypothetical protein